MNFNITGRAEIRLEKEVSTGIFTPLRTRWEEIKKQIVEIEKATFGEKADSEEFLEKEFMNDKNIVILLIYSGVSIIGYTYVSTSQKTGFEKIAHMESIGILPEYQNRGMVGILSKSLEDELTSRGFRFLTMKANVENGYADKVKKYYKDRIVESYDIVSDIYGEQRYFRIRLQ